jgi:hypothetical protein
VIAAALVSRIAFLSWVTPALKVTEVTVGSPVPSATFMRFLVRWAQPWSNKFCLERECGGHGIHSNGPLTSVVFGTTCGLIPPVEKGSDLGLLSSDTTTGGVGLDELSVESKERVDSGGHEQGVGRGFGRIRQEYGTDFNFIGVASEETIQPMLKNGR